LLASAIILYLPFLGELPFLHEEPRRALIARTMMETGEFFVPMLLEDIYTAKPPLFNWLIVAFSLPGGEITEFTARLPSVVFLLLTAIIMVVGLRRYLSQSGQLFLGMAILLTPELMAKATIAEIEIIFVFFVTMSIWSWYWLYDRGYTGIRLWFIPLVVVAASFLTKREPSLVFFYFSVVSFLIYEKRLKELFSVGHIISFAMMCTIIGGWLVVMAESVGVDALLTSLQSEVVNRGLTSSVMDYLKHFVFYPLQLFAGLIPLSFLLIPLYMRDTRELLKQRYGKLFIFCVLVVLVNLPLYWFRGDAAVRYYMPMFPTLLVLITLLFEIFYQQYGIERFTHIIRKVVKFFSVTLFLLALMLLITSALPLWKSSPSLLLPWYIVLIISIPVLMVTIRLMRSSFQALPKSILPVLIGNLIVVKLLYFSAYLPSKIERISQGRNGEIVMKKIEALVPVNEKIQTLGHTHYALWFYAKPGLLRVPKKFNYENYKGYVLAYENDATLNKIIGSKWQLIEKIPYRDITLVLGKLN